VQAVPSFTVTSEITGDVYVVAVAGEIDLETAPQVRQALASAEASDARVIRLALSQVTFMDSTGIALLVEHTERSRANGNRLRIFSSPAVDRVLEISGLVDRFPIDR
jgi:anti-sigma B factor antagonist